MNCNMDKNINILKDKTYRGERPLFKISFFKIEKCKFEDGESALKFAKKIKMKGCVFASKYISWHNDDLRVKESFFDDGARASIWYSTNVKLRNCNIISPKIFRDASKISIKNCSFDTDETLWDCKDIKIKDTTFKGDYLLFHSSNINIENFDLDGNYSFQHTKNVILRNIKIKSKDAFWNSEDITIYDSIIQGEYLGWHSNNLKFVNCKIIGTQPLCYAKNLVLENCEMINTDLAFEESSLEATIISSIDSIKNPLNGYIKAKKIKKIIQDDKNDDVKIEVNNGI